MSAESSRTYIKSKFSVISVFSYGHNREHPMTTQNSHHIFTYNSCYRNVQVLLSLLYVVTSTSTQPYTRQRTSTSATVTKILHNTQTCLFLLCTTETAWHTKNHTVCELQNVRAYKEKSYPFNSGIFAKKCTHTHTHTHIYIYIARLCTYPSKNFSFWS